MRYLPHCARCGGAGGLLVAVEAAKHYPQLRIIAVTVMTSLNEADLQQLGGARGLDAQVLAQAKLAEDCGCHGVVASAQEAAFLKTQLRADMHIVVPGIHLTQPAFDQQRSASAPTAWAAGATHLVVGRAITTADDPIAALADLQQQA